MHFIRKINHKKSEIVGKIWTLLLVKCWVSGRQVLFLVQTKNKTKNKQHFIKKYIFTPKQLSRFLRKIRGVTVTHSSLNWCRMQFLREDDKESKVCRQSYLSNVKEVTLKNSQNMKKLYREESIVSDCDTWGETQ